jgi:capsid assembly protease
VQNLDGPWLMAPGPLRRHLKRLARLRRVADPGQLAAARRVALGRMATNGGAQRQIGVATLPIRGPICHHFDSACWWFGGTATEMVCEVLGKWLGDDNIKAICLDIDSPGGGAPGVEELSDLIFKARAIKPIFGIVNSMCASAAYWLGSACSTLACIPSGEVGSIGAWACHVDLSGALASQGVKVTLVASSRSPYKTEGNPYEPLSDEGQEHMQEVLDETMEKFVDAVARNRGVRTNKVLTKYGQGRTLLADAALKAGMVDRIMPAPAFLQAVATGAIVPSRRSAARLEHAAPVEPRDDEDEEDFLERCEDAGGSEEECQLAWDQSAAAKKKPDDEDDDRDEDDDNLAASGSRPSIAMLRARQAQRKREAEVLALAIDGGDQGGRLLTVEEAESDAAEERRRRTVLTQPQDDSRVYHDDGPLPLLAGYCAVWDTEYFGDSRGRETYQHGAFDSALRSGGEIYALISHGGAALGSTHDGSLTLVADDVGLRVLFQPPSTPQGAALVRDIRAGRLCGMSHGSKQRRVAVGYHLCAAVHAVMAADLGEVSFTAYPANPDCCACVLEDLRLRSNAQAFNAGFRPRVVSPAPGQVEV